MISKKDVKIMPFTFIISPILLVSLTIIMIDAYNDIIEEKEFIANLSCPELKAYADKQMIDSKLYFGNTNYLIYAEERLNTIC